MNHSLAYELLSPVRQQLLLRLKKRGEGDMETLAAEMALSPGAVRQNLAALHAQGVVRYSIDRSGAGRPRHIYRLTRAGQRIFPDLYDELAAELLTALRGENPEVRSRVMKEVAEGMFATIQERVEGKRPGDRVREVIKLLAERGYLPETSTLEPGVDEVTVYHCPLFTVARRHPETCEAELRSFQLAAGRTTVTRSAHLLAGDGVCKFVFKQR